MKRLLNRLNRMMMLFLALIPVLSAIFPLLLNSIWTGSAWFFCQTACAALIALIPAYVGSYREYDVITYEGSRTNDPNPDREATHTLVKEGKRFPLRIFAALGFLAIELILLFLIPSEWFKDGTLVKRLAFLAIMLLIEIYALRDFPSIHFIWDDIPGVFIGVICYLAISIYLAFTKADVSDMKKLVSVAAVLYLFFASVTLNRQSITQSMSAHQGETRKPPKQILIKNRTIVLSFASLVTIVSVIEPVRKGVIWLLRKVRDFAGWIRSLFGGGESETVSELPFDMMPAQPEFVEAAEEAYEHSLFSDIIVYGFLLIVAIGFLWMLWDKIRALVDKLTKWLEKFAGNIQEGFYDEKEELMSAEEAKDILKNRLKNGLKALFQREPRWQELSGRERARRLLRDFYKKRARKIENLRTKTAREAIQKGDTFSADKEKFSAAYDRARYSSLDVSPQEMDEIKKDLRL